MNREENIDKLEEELRQNHIHFVWTRGNAGGPARVVYVELLSNLLRIAAHSANIALKVLEEGESGWNDKRKTTEKSQLSLKDERIVAQQVEITGVLFSALARLSPDRRFLNGAGFIGDPKTGSFLLFGERGAWSWLFFRGYWMINVVLVAGTADDQDRY